VIQGSTESWRLAVRTPAGPLSCGDMNRNKLRKRCGAKLRNAKNEKYRCRFRG
jgi:hypothetical protein